MTNLKETYEATGQGEYVHVGLPQYKAQALADQKKEPGPDTLSAEAELFRERGRICYDLLSDRIGDYLSQWEGETDPEFKVRKKNAEYSFTNFYEQTTGNLADQVFAKALTHEFPESAQAGEMERVIAFWDNVENRKRTPINGTHFARTIAEMSLGLGGTPAILIDFPPLPTDEEGNPQRFTDQSQSGERTPCWCRIHPWNIIDAEPDDEGNLVQFRFFQSGFKRSEWTREVEPEVVVLRRGPVGGFATRQVYRLGDEKKYVPEGAPVPYTPPENASPAVKVKFREIPVVGVPTGAAGWFADPQLRNVATLNVRHLRKSVDFDVAESVASLPIWASFGIPDEDLQRWKVGVYHLLSTDRSPADAKLENVSFGFDTSQSSLKTLESIERLIAMASKDPQSQRATGEEKSTIRLLDEQKSKSRLQAWALIWLASFQSALEWAGAWMGIEEVGQLGYLDEVFESLNVAPSWADFSAFVDRLLDSPPGLWAFEVSEAKRHGVISDEHSDSELLKQIEAAAAGGGLSADSE